MDMTRFLKSYLNVPELQKLGGTYEGVIENVTEAEIRNRFTTRTTKEPVLEFEDGRRMVLNLTMLKECIGALGADSTSWSGQAVRVSLQRIETQNHTSAETRVAWHRKIACVDTPPAITSDDVFGD